MNVGQNNPGSNAESRLGNDSQPENLAAGYGQETDSQLCLTVPDREEYDTAISGLREQLRRIQELSRN